MYRTLRCFAFALLLAAATAPAIAASAEPGSVVRIRNLDPVLVTELEESLDMWFYHPVEHYALAFVTAEQRDLLERSGLEVEVDRERTAQHLASIEPRTAQGSGIPGFPCYRTVEETYADLAQLAADNPTLATWTDIGDSWEKINTAGPGYDIFVLRLGNRSVPGPKAQFVLIAAMHAREYATAELATSFAEALVATYGIDPYVTSVLDHTEIHIVPQLNPDGRKRAEAGQSWRKNADNDHCSNTSSRGVDLNRNSGFFWGGPFSSGSACSGSFRGPSAGSEPETEAIEAYIDAVFTDQRGDGIDDAAPADATGLFISLHSFGELVLWPWEGQSTPSPNHTGLTTLGRRFGFFNGYLACQTGLPPASGTTVDQAYGEYGVASYTFEIGNSFFESCQNFGEIRQNNRVALFLGARAARRPYLEPAGPEVSGGGAVAGDVAFLSASAIDSQFDSNGCGTEPVQNVASISFTVDTPPWLGGTPHAMMANDGAFDSPAEAAQATLDVTGLAPGRHMLYFTSTDSDGNTGLPGPAFLDVPTPGALFEDGFESGNTSAWTLTVAP